MRAVDQWRPANLPRGRRTRSDKWADGRAGDRILDKGVVVDAFIRVALVGIELIAIEVRAVIASVETYLRYAEAVGLTAEPAVAA